MGKKHNTHFSYYKCLFCDGYHIGKNRDNKTEYDKQWKHKIWKRITGKRKHWIIFNMLKMHHIEKSYGPDCREYTECSYVVSFSDAERAIEIALGN